MYFVLYILNGRLVLLLFFLKYIEKSFYVWWMVSWVFKRGEGEGGRCIEIVLIKERLYSFWFKIFNLLCVKWFDVCFDIFGFYGNENEFYKVVNFVYILKIWGILLVICMIVLYYK